MGKARVVNNSSEPVRVARRTVTATAVVDGSVVSTGASTSEGAEAVTIPAGGTLELSAALHVYDCSRSSGGSLAYETFLPAGEYEAMGEVLLSDGTPVRNKPVRIRYRP